MGIDGPEQKRELIPTFEPMKDHTVFVQDERHYHQSKTNGIMTENKPAHESKQHGWSILTPELMKDRPMIVMIHVKRYCTEVWVS